MFRLFQSAGSRSDFPLFVLAVYVWSKRLEGVAMNSKRFDQRKLLRRFQDKGKPLTECFTEVLTVKTVDLRPATLRSYSSAARNFVRIIGDVGITEVCERKVDEFKLVRSKEVSAHSLNVDLRSLRALFATAHRWKYCETNPFEKVKLAKIPQVDPLYFTQDQLQTLIASISNETFRALILFGYFTGCRLSEIAHLTWDNIDFSQRMVSVKNSKEFTTKSQRNRRIPICDSLITVLFQLEKKKRSPIVFSKYDGSMYKPCSISRKLKRLLKQLNFDSNYHFHILRHTTASTLAKKNVSLYSISKILGHSSIKMSERYAHLLPEDNSENINKLNFNF